VTAARKISHIANGLVTLIPANLLRASTVLGGNASVVVALPQQRRPSISPWTAFLALGGGD